MRRRSAGPASAAGGAIYARRHFGQVDAHVVAEQMEDMRKMFGEIIQTSTWMDAATKQYAYEKLQAMEFNIGAPDYAYIDLTLDAVLPGVLLRPTDSYATMLRKLQVAAQSQQMSLLPKRKRHSMSVVMSPLVANAYNDLFLNAVCK